MGECGANRGFIIKLTVGSRKFINKLVKPYFPKRDAVS